MPMTLPYRSHVSFQKFDALDLSRDYDINDNHVKPKGFWYGIRFDWSKFVKEELGIKTRSYLYEVKLKPRSLATFDDPPDFDKILQIKTEDDLRKFYERYVKIVDRKGSYSWSRLKRDFGGVEIPNINMKGISKMDPVFGVWDVSSGVVWNLSIIVSCRLVRLKK